MGGDRTGGVEIDNRILNLEFFLFYVNVQSVFVLMCSLFFVCSCICFCHAEVWVGTTEEELKLINSCGRHKTFLGLTPHAPIWPFTLSISSTNSHVLRLAYFQLIDDLLRVAFLDKYSV